MINRKLALRQADLDAQTLPVFMTTYELNLRIRNPLACQIGRNLVAKEGYDNYQFFPSTGILGILLYAVDEGGKYIYIFVDQMPEGEQAS